MLYKVTHLPLAFGSDFNAEDGQFSAKSRSARVRSGGRGSNFVKFSVALVDSSAGSGPSRVVTHLTEASLPSIFGTTRYELLNGSRGPRWASTVAVIISDRRLSARSIF